MSLLRTALGGLRLPGVTRPIFIAMVAAASSFQASAQPVAYARQPVTIRCGILLIDSTASSPGLSPQPTNADPYVFFNLDRRTDLKPPGWAFDNPFAPGTVTPQIEARWTSLMGANNPFRTSERLTKNMAPYWEVYLSQISEKKITGYDVLLIHAPGLISLNPLEREKLRLFMDAGGILWFDKASLQTVDGFNGLPIPFKVLSTGSDPRVIQPAHPILNYPYQIGAFEGAFLGTHQGRHAIQRQLLSETMPPSLTGWDQVIATLEPDFDRVNPIVTNSSGVVVGVAPMGQGFAVLTSGNVVSSINEPAGGTNIGFGLNSGPIAGEQFQNIPITELKFVYNLIAMAGSHPGLSKGTRRLNASFDNIGAPLLQSWSDPNADFNQGSDTNYVPPAVYKGLVLVTSGNRVLAYKADMNRDLDGDGLTDDGFRDASAGATFDLVWASTPLPELHLSSPVAAEVSSGSLRDQVYVVGNTGTLYVFNAFKRGANGRLEGQLPVAPAAAIAPPATAAFNLSADNRGPYPPAFLEGLIYVYDSFIGIGGFPGRVWVASATTLQSTGWFLGGVGSNMAEPSGAPTAGYIPTADNPGGLDKVLYVSSRSSLTGPPNGISSVWIGARAEAPVDIQRTATFVDIATRASQRGLSVALQGNSSVGVRVYLVYDTGVPLSPQETATYLDGSITQFAPGRLRLGLRQSLPANIGARVDYHVDWGSGTVQVSQVLRGQLFFPDDVTRARWVVKSMALAPNGNLFVIAGNEQNNGTLFCLNEFARGQFKLVYRWDLHDTIVISPNNTATVTLPPAIEDRDDLWRLLFPSAVNPYPRLRRLHFHGSPTIFNEVCYVTVFAEQQTPMAGVWSGMYILAFDANPPRIDVRLGAPVPAGFRMRQPDMAASSNRLTPERYVTMQRTQVELDSDAGVVRFSNMMSGISGQMQNAFSTSLPVLVAGQGQPETVLDPNATGSKWSPLLWYFGYPGFASESPPLVMGSTLYAAGATALAKVMRGQPPFPPDGALFAMDAEIPPNDESIITIPGRPGLRQSRWLIRDPSIPFGFRSNRHVRWPSGEGVRSGQDFAVRVEQTLLGGNARDAQGVVGGDGTIVAWARQGLFGFKRANTVIADEGRVLELDAAGFMQWSTDMSYDFARSASTTLVQTRAIERPTKVYKLADNEYAIVDSGGDRIVRIDKSAGVVRSVERISLDASFRPSGWNEGDPLELHQPKDVSVWVDFVPPANNAFAGPRPTSTELWVHYLIADTGNRRMIELVDRYVAELDSGTGAYRVTNVVRDANGEPQLGKLVWHTPAALSGKSWQYTGIQRFQVGVGANNNPLFIFVAAIGDVMPARINVGLDPPSAAGPRETGGGVGGIVIFDDVNGNQVINEVLMPNNSIKKLIGINTVFVRPVGLLNLLTDYRIMFTDATGVYEIQKSALGQWRVEWMLDNQTYFNIRGVNLRAMAAKRLPNGDVLITNGYVGRTVSGADFFGEVTQWADDYVRGFSRTSVKLEVPPVVGSKGLRNPQFADRL